MQRFEGNFRAMRLQLEADIGERIPLHHPIIHWMVEAAAELQRMLWVVSSLAHSQLIMQVALRCPGQRQKRHVSYTQGRASAAAAEPDISAVSARTAARSGAWLGWHCSGQ